MSKQYTWKQLFKPFGSNHLSWYGNTWWTRQLSEFYTWSTQAQLGNIWFSHGLSQGCCRVKMIPHRVKNRNKEPNIIYVELNIVQTKKWGYCEEQLTVETFQLSCDQLLVLTYFKSDPTNADCVQLLKSYTKYTVQVLVLCELRRMIIAIMNTTSAGGALHWYFRGYRFNSRTGLKFSGFNFTTA